MPKSVLTVEEKRVVSAWVKPGSHPVYHAQKVAQLKREWPMLAEAVEALVRKASI